MLTTPSQHKVLLDLFNRGTKLTYRKGEFIIRPGENQSGIFYIVSGIVKAYDITKYGEENLLIIRKDGDIIGLTRAITGEERSIIYSTLSPTELLYISQDQFRAFLYDNPEAALPLIDKIVEMYKLHSERILTLEYRSVRERIISFLIGISKKFGKTTDRGLVLEVPLRHQDIASSISATRETTSRELSVLERQGLIVRDRQSIITICNMEKLRSYLG